ncbi:MAG: alpha-amylase/4-alpha-glucanotransferase domain-containing protein [candidate division WOR-3 bacterium]
MPNLECRKHGFLVCPREKQARDMTYFVIGLHNHQPIDNLEAVFEQVYQQAYWPFLQVLRRYDFLKLNFHLSGSLLDWLLERHPEYVAELKAFVAARRIELLTSGYYEPVLSIIPEADRVEQIVAYTDRLAEVFGVRPKGLWLAERAWEQSLVSSIAKAGVEFTLVDDTLLPPSCVGDGRLDGYYITEDQGHVLSVFPIAKQLRYLVPFRPVSEVIAYLTQADIRERLAVLFDDGEKFGAWPGTYGHVYGDAAGSTSSPRSSWLDQFFSALGQRADCTTVLLSDYRDMFPPLGLIYLDNGSYDEMDQWLLSSRQRRAYEECISCLSKDTSARRFVRSGYFRQFLTKYPEANRLHKRMLFVSAKIRSSRKPKERLKSAKEELFKGQANDAYWHGVFGGLYLPHLRQGAYRRLLSADRLLAENLGMQLVDFDVCGQKEIVFDYHNVFICLSPSKGGCLLELDAKAPGINWLDTLTRQPEGYHQELTKQTGTSADEPNSGAAVASIHDQRLQNTAGRGVALHYDSLPRWSLVEHFYTPGTKVSDIHAATAQEMHQVAQSPRNYEIDGHKVILSLVDFLPEKPSHVYKEIVTSVDHLLVTYDIYANFWRPSLFAVDFNSLPLTKLEIDGTSVSLEEPGERDKVSKVQLVHGSGAALVIRSGRAGMRLAYYPVETVSSSEKGIDRIYQGTALVLMWELSKPALVFQFEILWQ